MTPSSISTVSPPAGSPPASTPVATSPCLVTPVVVAGQPNTYKAAPGTIRLKILPGSGTFTFDVLNCAVRDSANAVVPIDSNATPTTLSFAVAAGNSYVFSAAYFFNSNATATLIEDCTGQTPLDSLNALQAAAGRSYPIAVS
jgi:hypothetical protein